MNTIQERENELIEEFEMFEDWMEKYNYIIDLGKSLPEMGQEHKIEDNLISGCQSQVWLHAEMKEGKVFFNADSDALIPKGIISILLRILSGHSPKEIVDADLTFIKGIGLEEHLSPNRANGLMAMVSQMKKFALVFQSQLN